MVCWTSERERSVRPGRGGEIVAFVKKDGPQAHYP